MELLFFFFCLGRLSGMIRMILEYNLLLTPLVTRPPLELSPNADANERQAWLFPKLLVQPNADYMRLAMLGLLALSGPSMM